MSFLVDITSCAILPVLNMLNTALGVAQTIMSKQPQPWKYAPQPWKYAPSGPHYKYRRLL